MKTQILVATNHPLVHVMVSCQHKMTYIWMLLCKYTCILSGWKALRKLVVAENDDSLSLLSFACDRFSMLCHDGWSQIGT